MTNAQNWYSQTGDELLFDLEADPQERHNLAATGDGGDGRPDAILDMAVTHGANMVLLGLTRRGALWKAIKGDVIQAVAEHLPEDIGLLIHA